MADVIKIEIRKCEFARGMAIRRSLATKRDVEDISITIAGEDAPDWAYAYAKAAANANEPGVAIAETIMAVYDLSKNGKRMQSHYDGRCKISGRHFDAGTEIFYSFDSKAALVNAVEAVLRGEVPNE